VQAVQAVINQAAVRMPTLGVITGHADRRDWMISGCWRRMPVHG